MANEPEGTKTISTPLAMCLTRHANWVAVMAFLSDPSITTFGSGMASSSVDQAGT
jgi:hypothetical protein